MCVCVCVCVYIYIYTFIYLFIHIVHFRKIIHIFIFLSRQSFSSSKFTTPSDANRSSPYPRSVITFHGHSHIDVIAIYLHLLLQFVSEWTARDVLSNVWWWSKCASSVSYGLLLRVDALLCITSLTEIFTYKIKIFKYQCKVYYVTFSYDMNRKRWNKHTVLWPDAIYEIHIWAMQNLYVPRKRLLCYSCTASDYNYVMTMKTAMSSVVLALLWSNWRHDGNKQSGQSVFRSRCMAKKLRLVVTLGYTSARDSFHGSAGILFLM